MKHSADIYNELKVISPLLAEREKTNVFSTPENYFSTLTNKILQRIDGDKHSILPASETLSLKVPEGYFESLAGNILKKIKSLQANNASEELKQLSPMLYAVQNENIFTVPGGYFENLPGKIINLIQSSSVKVVYIKKRNVVWNYAIAAMLTGVMAVSALWIKNNSLQQVPALDEKNIPSYVKDAFKYKNEQQINDGIASLADDDIIKYLENTSSNADDELLATTVEAKDLPGEQDYLIDENALDTFLNKIDKKNLGN